MRHLTKREAFYMLRPVFLRRRHEMSQADFQDFSDFAPNAYLSTLGESTSKNHNHRFSVTMFKKL